jgi:adenylosuccinate synthase
VIFEHHRLIDQCAERWRGEGRIGTTGRGIGPCYADKAARIGLRVCDLLDPALAARVCARRWRRRTRCSSACTGEPPLDLEGQLDRYTVARRAPAAVRRATPDAEVRAAYAQKKRVLFEGAQGALLDIDAGHVPVRHLVEHGHEPASPPARRSRRAARPIVGIAKAYCTRVGEGPFPSEQKNALGDRIREARHEYGATTAARGAAAGSTSSPCATRSISPAPTAGS